MDKQKPGYGISMITFIRNPNSFMQNSILSFRESSAPSKEQGTPDRDAPRAYVQLYSSGDGGHMALKSQ